MGQATAATGVAQLEKGKDEGPDRRCCASGNNCGSDLTGYGDSGSLLGGGEPEMAVCTNICVAGVVGRLEECDDDVDNSDINVNACRTDCSRQRCGDGIVDTGEQREKGPGCARDCTRIAPR